MIMIRGWNFAQKWWDDLMKIITFSILLYFPMKRHSNYMDLSIADIGMTKFHTGWEIFIQYPQKLNVWGEGGGNTRKYNYKTFFLNEECQSGELFTSLTKLGTACYSKVVDVVGGF